MKRTAIFVLACMLVCACASPNLNQWDTIFKGNASLTRGVPAERMGVLFGTIAIVPPNEDLAGVSLTLRPLGDRSQGSEVWVFAANKRYHMLFRQPDIDASDRRVWLFSGQLPAGIYEIASIGVSYGNVMNVRFMEPEHPVRIPILAARNMYLGRWQVSPEPYAQPGPRLVLDGSQVLVRDAFADDAPLFESFRKTRTLPYRSAPLDNPLPAVMREVRERAAS
jgi:hypothetical protein